MAQFLAHPIAMCGIPRTLASHPIAMGGIFRHWLAPWLLSSHTPPTPMPHFPHFPWHAPWLNYSHIHQAMCGILPSFASFPRAVCDISHTPYSHLAGIAQDMCGISRLPSRHFPHIIRLGGTIESSLINFQKIYQVLGPIVDYQPQRMNGEKIKNISKGGTILEGEGRI